MITYIGVDPGIDGAIAAIPAENGNVIIWDIPTNTLKSGKKTRREVDISKLQHHIAEIGKMVSSMGGTMVWVLEKVHSMPQNGVVASFSFGYLYGVLKASIVATGYRICEVSPQEWKKNILSGQAKEKDASRLKAIDLWPQNTDLFSLKKDHNRAEAALIGEYGRRMNF